VDIREVHSFAEGFASAIVTGEDELITSYLCAELEANLKHLGDISPSQGGAHLRAEVLSVVAHGDEFDGAPAQEFVSMTSFSGQHEEVLVRAMWAQDSQQLLIRKLQMIDRKREGETPGVLPTDDESHPRVLLGSSEAASA
jgi:hypothetical protein